MLNGCWPAIPSEERGPRDHRGEMRRWLDGERARVVQQHAGQLAQQRRRIHGHVRVRRHRPSVAVRGYRRAGNWGAVDEGHLPANPLQVQYELPQAVLVQVAFSVAEEPRRRQIVTEMDCVSSGFGSWA